jgi:hypothetical protein
VVVILLLITLIGFYLAGYSMRIPSMTLEHHNHLNCAVFTLQTNTDLI